MMLPTIPVWVFRLIFMIMAPIGAGAVWLTRKYSVSSLRTQNLSAEEIMVRTLSIDVLMAAHLAAFFIVALLPGDKFRAWRWKLIALAVCIWAFDAGNIYQARFSIMDKADSTLASAAERYKTKKKTIEDLQASAKERRAQADREWANGRWTDAKNGRNKASAESDEAVRLTKELDKMPDGAGSSEVKAWGGEEGARWRAMIEAGLVSFVLIVAAGLAGAMVRELLLPAAAARPVPAQPSTPTPAPVPAEKPVAPVTPAPAPKVSYDVPHLLLKTLGFGFAAAALHSVPAAQKPAPAAPADAIPERVYPVKASVPAEPEPVPVPDRVGASIPDQVRHKPERVRPSHTRRSNPYPYPYPQTAYPQARAIGALRHGYGRGGSPLPKGGRGGEGWAKEGINPSYAAIRKLAGCNQTVATTFRATMAERGIIEPDPENSGQFRLKVAA